MKFWNEDNYLKRTAAIPNCIEKVLLIELTCLLTKTLTGIFVTGHLGPTKCPVLARDDRFLIL